MARTFYNAMKVYAEERIPAGSYCYVSRETGRLALALPRMSPALDQLFTALENLTPGQIVYCGGNGAATGSESLLRAMGWVGPTLDEILAASP